MASRRYFTAAAGIAGVALALATLGASVAAGAPGSANPGLTESSCKASGGVYAITKGGLKTCTTVSTMTFSRIPHSEWGQFEPIADNPEAAWIAYNGFWESADVVTTTTTVSQKGSGPVTESSEQSVEAYTDVTGATCLQSLFDAQGNWSGGGQVADDTNVPCKVRGVLPPGAPDIYIPPVTPGP